MPLKRILKKLFGQIGECLTDFGEHTSAHGIPRAFNSRTILKKCLWLLLFFLCFTAFVFQAYYIICRFFRNDIIVGVEVKFENIPFPSVTVCNNNPYKNSLARQLAPIQETLQAYDNAIEKISTKVQSSFKSKRKKRKFVQNNFINKKIERKLYEKTYNEFESLLAVYSVCKCNKKIKNSDCKALKNNTNGTMCLCFYNRKNEQIWPCYRSEQWLEKQCNKCTMSGDCLYPETKGNFPCICAPIIKICVRIKDDLLSKNYLKENNLTLNNLTNIKLTKLTDRIPKIWEIEGSKLNNFKIINKQAAIEKEIAFGLKGISDPIAMRSKTTENLIFALSSLGTEIQSQLSYTKQEFITKCSFNGRQCFVENDFTLHLDPSYGNCYTFNYNSSNHIQVERAGPTYGLRFQVFVNISDYLPTTEAAGVRITIHSQEEVAFPEFGYNAPTGFISSFGIRLKRMNRLPAPYGDCVRNEKNDEYIYQGKDYSTEGCQRTCMQKHLVQICGCGDPRFPRYKNISNCPAVNSKLRNCIQRELKTTIKSKKCDCRQPCKQQVYTVSYSCARWPATTASLSNSECHSSLTAMQCLQFHREQGAMIEVYFEQLNYESLLESEAYGLSNLLSDFGGQLGLWMGVSVITIMEVGILISEISIQIFRQFCKIFTNNTKNSKQNFVNKKSLNDSKNINKKRSSIRNIQNPTIVKKYIKNYS